MHTRACASLGKKIQYTDEVITKDARRYERPQEKELFDLNGERDDVGCLGKAPLRRRV